MFISISQFGIDVNYRCYKLYRIFSPHCPDEGTEKCLRCKYCKASMSAEDATKLIDVYKEHMIQRLDHDKH